MLGLASMVLAAYFFCIDNFQMMVVPQPVIIQHGTVYAYDEIYSSISVPAVWNGTCNDQRRLLKYMELHFNAFKNGGHKLTEAKLDEINKKWVCVQ